MIKRFLVLCMASLMIGHCGFAAETKAVEQIPFVHPDQSVPLIVVPESPEDQERFAIEDLRIYLGRMTGQEFTVTSAAPANAFAIYVGKVEANKDLKEIVEKNNLGRDGFVLDISARGIRILGGSKFGTSYGVYEFLERLGVRWLFPGEWGEVVPKKTDITLNTECFMDKPAFSIRQMHTAFVRDAAGNWFRRSRHNRSGYYGHSHLIDLKTYGKEHPEWYAEINGARQVDTANFKLCHSNEAIVQQAIHDVLDQIRAREADTSEISHIGYKHQARDYSIISISPTDGGGFCQCAECKKMGTVSDRLQIFANRIADAVRKEYPNYFVGYYGAYSESQEPPTVKAHPGVMVFATTWTKNFFKPLDDISNAAYRSKLEGFLKTNPDIGIRDFDGLSVWWGYGPFSLADVHAKDYQWYKEHGIKGIISEAQSGWGPWGYSYYLLGKLWWNPYADLDALKKDFITSGYGDAAVPMTEYYRLLDQSGSYPSAQSLYRMRQCLESAAKIASTPETRLRIDYLRAHYLLLDIAGRQKEGTATPEDIGDFYHVLKSIDPHVTPYTVDRRFMRQFPVAPQDVKNLPPLNVKELEAMLAKVSLKDPGKSFPTWNAQEDLRLVPLDEKDAKFSPGIGMKLRFGPTPLLIYAKKGERIHVTQSSERNAFNTAYELKDPDLAVIAQGVATSAGDILDRVAGSDGIYTLTLSPGGYYPDIEVSNRYTVVKTGDIAQCAHPMGKVVGCFYVPGGTKEFSISSKAYEPLSIQFFLPDGKPLLSEIKQKSQIFEEHRVIVPEGSDGKVWKIEIEGGKKDVFLSGLPPFLASEPARLLVLPEIKK